MAACCRYAIFRSACAHDADGRRLIARRASATPRALALLRAVARYARSPTIFYVMRAADDAAPLITRNDYRDIHITHHHGDAA